MSALPSDDAAGAAPADAEEARFLFNPEMTGFLSSPEGAGCRNTSVTNISLWATKCTANPAADDDYSSFILEIFAI